MRTLTIGLMLFMLAAVLAADSKKDAARFSPGPAASYPAKQTNGKITLAVAAYNTPELAHTAFGKLDPNQYGVLPVLAIIQNDTDQTLKLDQLQVEYTGVDGRHLEATPGADVRQLGGAQRPSLPTGSPLPRLHKHKYPLDVWEIDGRAFNATLLPPHDSANGFFYFQTDYRPGSKFYLTGIKIASTGQDVLYFEIPLDNPTR